MRAEVFRSMKPCTGLSSETSVTNCVNRHGVIFQKTAIFDSKPLSL